MEERGGHEAWRREPIPGSYEPLEAMEGRRVYRVHARRGFYAVWDAPSRCFFVLGVEMNHRALIAEGHWDDGGSAWPVWRRKRSIRRRVAVVPPEVPLREGFKVPACLDGYYALT